MPKVFISHTWREPDKEISKRLNELLKSEDVEVWVDYEKAKGGDSLPEKISNGIVWCDSFVLLWSKAAAESYWVKLEWETALTKKKHIIPCPLDNTEMPAILERLVRISFRNLDEGYENLCRALLLTAQGERPSISEYVKVEIEEPKSNELKMDFNLLAGEEIALVTLVISVKENAKKIDAFGFELSFNPEMISFENISHGTLSVGWAAVSGNERKPGSLVVGGFAGAGKLIADGSSGSIAIVEFRIKDEFLREGAKGQISIKGLMDDLAGMKIVPSTAEFTYKRVKGEIEKERIEWKQDGEILQALKQPLKELNRINKFPDKYKALECLDLASKIERGAEKIQRPDLKELKERLLDYAGRVEHIDQNTSLKDLMKLFQRRVNGNKYEPALLLEEIEKALSVKLG